MRRQGRQHGLVRTYRILPPPLNPRLVNSLTSPQTSELFTTLPSRPTKTNHSKSNRKVLPGQVHWVRSNDIASSSYKLLTWRVRTEFGSEPVLNLPSISDREDNGGEGEVETMKTENNNVDITEKEDDGFHDDHDDHDESMSFYDVGMMMMEHVLDNDEEEDGWCLV